MKRSIELKYLFLIIVIFIAACIETDIYLPAFPDMMAWFSASESDIQGLLTWNFVGICLAGPFYGPLADAFGRKKPLLIALGMFLVGSLVTLFAANFDMMLFGRILQGIGSGGCFTLGTAIIFDAFKKERAISAINDLNTIVPIIMSVAPIAGGYLNHSFDFRSNFLCIALFVLLSLVITVFMFEETLPKEKRTSFDFKTVLNDFKRAFTNKAFWQITIAISLFFAGYIAFLSGSAVLFVVEFGMEKTHFPLVQAAVLGGWVAGSLCLNRVIRKWGIPKVKKVASIISVIGGIALAIATAFASRDPYMLTVGMVLYAFGANWIIGLYFPEGMEILPDIKGTTASLLTSARLLIAAVVVEFSSAFYNGTVYPLSFVVLGTLIVIIPMLFIYEKKRGVLTYETSGTPPIH